MATARRPNQGAIERESMWPLTTRNVSTASPMRILESNYTREDDQSDSGPKR